MRPFVSPFKAGLWRDFSGSYPGSSAGFVQSPALLHSVIATATPAAPAVATGTVTVTGGGALLGGLALAKVAALKGLALGAILAN